MYRGFSACSVLCLETDGTFLFGIQYNYNGSIPRLSRLYNIRGNEKVDVCEEKQFSGGLFFVEKVVIMGKAVVPS